MFKVVLSVTFGLCVSQLIILENKYRYSRREVNPLKTSVAFFLVKKASRGCHKLDLRKGDVTCMTVEQYGNFREKNPFRNQFLKVVSFYHVTKNCFGQVRQITHALRGHDVCSAHYPAFILV